ncbi:probable chitinase 2 [Danaus plexippus]|uniref:probable chitinase 2 n=1 Tax=Danaus plexippus TaxID=13037 RepID=UPI002AB2D5F0|nr:probable chitinase 2 [Danaus plexippus]
MNFYVVFSLSAILFSYTTAKDKVVICYHGTWATYRPSLGKFDVTNINTNLCTHIVYGFMGINAKGTVVSLDAYLDYPENWGRDNLRKFTLLKRTNPKLKALLAVGGWNEGSAKYSNMASKPSLRKNFITSAIRIIQKYGFDGLDIDWEYPNARDSVHGEADIDNFTQLLKELRVEFDKNDLILSAAVAAVTNTAASSYDIKGISQYLNFVNVMAYDINNPTDNATGHNAPVHGNENNLQAIDVILKYWIGQGCPPEKLVLGLPFYGHSYELADREHFDVGDSSTGPGIAGPYTSLKGMLGYNELCEKFERELWNIYYDDISKVPYAVQGRNWISFDDIDSLTIKIEYALKFNISGAMIWSIETDDFRGTCSDGKYPLLRAVNRALNKSEA